MDVAAAFPSIARGCLLQRMRNMKLDDDLVRWTDSFIRDSKVVISIDGQDGQPQAITTGLPQGSPVLPILFCIYISDVYTAVEQNVQEYQSISFVDDVTWFVEENSIEEVT